MAKVKVVISIHGLRVEPDLSASQLFVNRVTFQSTGSVWSPTLVRVQLSQPAFISIHGLRVEPDSKNNFFKNPITYFNPRAPCGARPTSRQNRPERSNFNPRAPCGARQLYASGSFNTDYFNPRAPCGARRERSRYIRGYFYFNPRAPCGARRIYIIMRCFSIVFQSTGSVWSPTTVLKSAVIGT